MKITSFSTANSSNKFSSSSGEFWPSWAEIRLWMTKIRGFEPLLNFFALFLLKEIQIREPLLVAIYAENNKKNNNWSFFSLFNLSLSLLMLLFRFTNIVEETIKKKPLFFLFSLKNVCPVPFCQLLDIYIYI